ncbi:SDR family NAD(P)-dependent oxidoreductase [Salinimonas sediminis]|uniref:SDR family NAD(P)-dependent oxidoreductase n=1 Tax=Salinimonas sediminis TaxID=2303538 RepID=A0A346NLP0_9ALTE|nr:SDR family NAD(P)-dependent oxidoreductase [Salinimonas sediminis]AXR06447.1 SDR family NAD(P)-dependent oxidoreductase [Salinimonas sediminis]
MTPIVFVTGGNRGIGQEIVRGYAQEGCKVLLGCRNEEDGEKVKKDIVGADIQIIEMDLSNDQDIVDRIVRAEAVYGRIDVLVNNAGVMDDADWQELRPAKLKRSMQVHVNGPLNLMQTLLPGMIERNYGRIINVSSGWGSFNEGMEGPLAYAVSKAALNALTLKLANGIDSDKNIKINAMCPGWVHTRMGGRDAPRTPEEGAETAIWLGLLDKDGPTGKFFRDKKEISW